MGVIKYFYSGKSLRQYCSENDITYSKILRRIEDYLASDGTLSDGEAVKKAMEEYVDPRCRFFYKGMSLKSFCDSNGYNFQRAYLRVKQLTDEREIEKALDEFVEQNPFDKRHIFDIDGMSLRAYCSKHNIVYPTIKTYIQNIRKDNPELSNQEVVTLAIKHYEENHIYKELWFYKGERLVDYCKRNNYSYNDIFGYLGHMNIPDTKDIPDEALELAIKKYKIKVRKDAFIQLKKCNSEEDYLRIINILNIDYESVKLVMSFNYDIRRAIYFVWYFGNEKDGLVCLDTKRINAVHKCLNKIDIFEINYLLGYYYAGIYDSRQLIYNRLFLSVRKIVSDLVKAYNLKFGSDYHEELKAEADVLIFEFINRTNSRYLGQIITYMNNYIRGCLVRKILRDKKENDNSSLNTYVYDDKKREKIDDIAAPIISVDPTYFSDEMLAIITKLSSREQSYVILKFQQLYEDEEIAKYLNISLEEVQILGEQVLAKLRDNDAIKLMKKY